MVRRFSLAHLTVLGWNPVEMIHNAATIGYDYVSVRTISMGVNRESDFNISKNKKLFNNMKAALEETGMRLYDIELARVADNVDVRGYEGHFEAAAKLGANGVISSIWTDNKPFYMEQFALLCDRAAQYGLQVNLEFPTWAGVWNLNGVLEVLETVKKDNAGVMVDTLHAYRSGVSLEELSGIPKRLLNLAHICDGPAKIPDRKDKEALIFTGRDARYYVGEGAIDIAGMVKIMREDTVLSIELPHIERVANYGFFEHAKRCFNTAKEYLTKNGIV